MISSGKATGGNEAQPKKLEVKHWAIIDRMCRMIMINCNEE